ncbi:hypothetical protein OIU77_028000 [Salix suchowensis]|uniref:Uncharacterized protein n=1 Tax=Salix suchowensis TaxID=1278906 RepID=A0ABQ9BU29_9ROSI|nr:hypothetical protein OIU77_028000 [Salix suchowensis]
MSAYSKIKIFGASKSRSTGFSDLSPALPAPAKSIANTFLQPHETSKNIAGARDSLSVPREDEGNNAGEGSRSGAGEELLRFLVISEESFLHEKILFGVRKVLQDP